MIDTIDFVLTVADTFAGMTGNRLNAPRVHPASTFNSRMNDVADWYVNALPNNPVENVSRSRESLFSDSLRTECTWRSLGEWVDAQYVALSERITFDVVGTDSYSSADAMMADVATGHLFVLDSATTGVHPMWSHTTNNRFRAVHDVMGHFLRGVGFDRYGEDAAYRAHKATLPKSVWPALATETRGQSAALNYALPYGVFKEQKCVLAPEWVIE